METKEFYTTRELLELAAGSKGVDLRDNTKQSRAIKSYALDSHLLSLLKEDGVRVYSESQYLILEYAGGRWNYTPHKGKNYLDLHIDLEVMAYVKQEYRGVLFVPYVWGCSGCSSEAMPHKHMFQLLVECDENSLQIAREIAESEGEGLVVGWSELGLGGLRTLGEVFREFFGENEVIEHIARKEYVFDPLPYPRFPRDKTIHVIEPAQPRIIQAWREQLNNYRSRFVA